MSGTAWSRWRCIDLRQRIKDEFGVELHERSVGKLLRRLKFTRLQPRPYHPKKDAAAQEAFKKEFASQVAEVVPAAAAGKPLEIWFGDEARVGQKGTLTSSGRDVARARRRFAITAMTPPISSAPFAPSAASALPSSCRPPTARRWPNI